MLGKNLALRSVMFIMLSTATLLMFQNCSSSSENNVQNSLSCANNSVLKNAYPGGFSLSLPLGTSVNCDNSSGYNIVSFNPGSQSITLSSSTGAASSVTYALRVGGAACNAGMVTGGDDFANLNGTVLSTQLGATELRIVVGGDSVVPGSINCIVNR